MIVGYSLVRIRLRGRSRGISTSATVSSRPKGRLPLNEKGERATENTLRHRLYGWVRKSCIKKQELKPHDLRRTFGTWFLQTNPMHVRELAKLVGYSDLSAGEVHPLR